MKKSSIFVGLDVHKNSIEIAIAAAGRNGEIRSYGKIDGSLAALDKVIRKLVSKGCELHFVYEAAPVVMRFIATSPLKGSIAWSSRPQGFPSRVATESKMTVGMPKCLPACTGPAN